MKICVVHNEYTVSGGEEVSASLSALALRELGLEVLERRVSSGSQQSLSGKFNAAVRIRSGCAKSLASDLARQGVSLCAVHNFHPLISPLIFRELQHVGIRCIWTVHNFRFRCVNGMYFRDGAICEDCAGMDHSLLGVARRCYKGSFLASASMAFALSRNFWTNEVWPYVDVVLANSEFTRSKIIEAGYCPKTLRTLLNFSAPVAPFEAPFMRKPSERGYFFYAGRLSEEKGLDVIIRAMHALPNYELRIAGAGPCLATLESMAPSNVFFLGRLDQASVAKEMRSCIAALVPSRFYETFGRTLIDASREGVPCISIAHGASGQLVEAYGLGATVASHSVDDWVHAMKQIADQATDSRFLRSRFEELFSFQSGVRAWKAVIDSLEPPSSQ